MPVEKTPPGYHEPLSYAFAEDDVFNWNHGYRNPDHPENLQMMQEESSATDSPEPLKAHLARSFPLLLHAAEVKYALPVYVAISAGVLSAR